MEGQMEGQMVTGLREVTMVRRLGLVVLLGF